LEHTVQDYDRGLRRPILPAESESQEDPVCAKELAVIDVGEWDHIYKVLLYAGRTTTRHHSPITGGVDARCVGN
jgi:hypothetical protein